MIEELIRFAQRNGLPVDERTVDFLRIVEAASRRQERLQQREEAIKWVNENNANRKEPYKPGAELVQDLPNGFAVKKLKTYGELGFEGHMMNHCLKDDYRWSCETCGGHGECTNCDNGYTDCNECDNQGSKECSWCDGKGRYDCGNCYGHGTVSEWNDDLEKDEDVDCPDCKDGEVECEDCEGKGSFTCGDCGGEGRFTCRVCDGNNVCEDCYGEGNTGYHGANDPIDIDTLERASGQPYSLRNPDDIPVVTWWEDFDGNLESVYGRGNEQPKPEYQHLLLNYINKKKFGDPDLNQQQLPLDTKEREVSVSWGRGNDVTYTPKSVRPILDGTEEKPNHLYFYHNHYSCPNGQCDDNQQFYSTMFPRSSDAAWQDFSRLENRREDSPTTFTPLYRVDTKDINPQHLIFSPADDTYIINPSKMKDQPRDIFKPINSKFDFSPSTYTDITPATDENDLRNVRTSAWKSVRSN